MSITGKMSTIIRVIDSAPISTMSNAAIAEVYGLRRAMRTRPIIPKLPLYRRLFRRCTEFCHPGMILPSQDFADSQDFAGTGGSCDAAAEPAGGSRDGQAALRAGREFAGRGAAFDAADRQSAGGVPAG